MNQPKRQSTWPAVAVMIAVATLLSGLPDYVSAQSSGLSEDCIAFDADRAEVRRYSASWKLVFGTLWLKDFGDNEQEARRALQIIQHYGMNKQCFVGRPDPSLEYYLAADDAPVGPLPGEDCTSFDPDRISVVIANGRYTIIEGDNWLLDFGRSKSEALKALKLIRTYQFTHLCFVGRPDPSFIYFRTSQRSAGGGEETGAVSGREGTASSTAVRILVYGTNACSRCVSIKRSLSDENIVYTFYDINREAERKDEMFRHVNREHQGISRVSVPVVVVGEAVLINPSFAQVQQELAAATARAAASGSGPVDTAASSWEDGYYERYDHRSFFAYGPANEKIRLNSIDYPLLRAALFYETNRMRTKNGRPPLAFHPGCAAAAQLHAEDMVKGKFYSHTNPNDPSKTRPRDRVALFDVHWGWMAENINQGMGNGTYVEVARQYVDSWMHSSGHRANMLNPVATHLGTGAYNAGHKLSDLYFDVVQIFAEVRE